MFSLIPYLPLAYREDISKKQVVKKQSNRSINKSTNKRKAWNLDLFLIAMLVSFRLLQCQVPLIICIRIDTSFLPKLISI